MKWIKLLNDAKVKVMSMLCCKKKWKKEKKEKRNKKNEKIEIKKKMCWIELKCKLWINVRNLLFLKFKSKVELVFVDFV